MGAPKVLQWSREGPKRSPKGAKWNQRAQNGAKKGTKIVKRGAKRDPKSTQMLPRIATPKGVEKGNPPQATNLGFILGAFGGQKFVSKIATKIETQKAWICT